MGWLVHSAEETTWGFTRLFWTAIGILISLWATRYVWPSAAIPSLHRQFAAFIDAIIQEINLEVDRWEADAPTRLSMQQRRERPMKFARALQRELLFFENWDGTARG